MIALLKPGGANATIWTYPGLSGIVSPHGRGWRAPDRHGRIFSWTASGKRFWPWRGSVNHLLVVGF